MPTSTFTAQGTGRIPTLQASVLFEVTANVTSDYDEDNMKYEDTEIIEIRYWSEKFKRWVAASRAVFNYFHDAAMTAFEQNAHIEFEIYDPYEDYKHEAQF